MFKLFSTIPIQRALATHHQSQDAYLNTLWHKRYVHLNFRSLISLQKTNMVQGLPQLYIQKDVCESCCMGKQHRQYFPTCSLQSTDILQIVHSDLWGPTSVQSFGKALYFITFIDDYSRKTWIYFLKQKSDALNIFKDFKSLVEKQTGKYIKILRCDNGGEYKSLESNAFCRHHGIKH